MAYNPKSDFKASTGYGTKGSLNASDQHISGYSLNALLRDKDSYKPEKQHNSLVMPSPQANAKQNNLLTQFNQAADPTVSKDTSSNMNSVNRN